MAGASALEGSVPVTQPQLQVLALSEPQGLGPQPLCHREVAICRRRPSVEGSVLVLQGLALEWQWTADPQPCHPEVMTWCHCPLEEGVSFKQTVQQEVTALAEFVLQSLPRAKWALSRGHQWRPCRHEAPICSHQRLSEARIRPVR